MSRVNVDAQALLDSRFARLAYAMDFADADHAIGKMVRLWMECTLRETEELHEAEIGFAWQCASNVAAKALEQSGLGEIVESKSDGVVVRIKGCKGRTDWLAAKRKAGAKGGKKSGKARKVKVEAKRISASDSAEANPKHATNTPAPAPAPALAPANNPPSPPGGELPGWSKLRAKQRSTLSRHLPECRRLWELQNQLRGGHPLKGTAERLMRVADRLEAGATPDECEIVLRAYAAEAKKSSESAQWFNGETNWRKDNFDRALGRGVQLEHTRAGDFGDDDEPITMATIFGEDA